jgi:hypothetical protein
MIEYTYQTPGEPLLSSKCVRLKVEKWRPKNFESGLKLSHNDDASVDTGGYCPVTAIRIYEVIFKPDRTYRKAWTDRLQRGLKFEEFWPIVG